MKIHYSPCFDGEHYIDFQGRGNLLIDELVVGNSGLLKELELRSGLTCECLPDVERQANYYNAVKSVLEEQPGSFISNSFEIDEYGVASELLRWRDELMVAGWNSGMRNVSVKLDLLSDIELKAEESGLTIKGDSDRWRLVLEGDLGLLDKDDELIIHFPNEFLPPHIKAIILKLSGMGINCTYLLPEQAIAGQDTNLHKIQSALLSDQHEALVQNHDNDDSFRILRFERQNAAHDWIVSNNISSKAVFVNSDNRSFDLVQSLFGHPASGSFLPDANPEIVQMFKLGCSLFIRPFNIYNLLSYLQITRHPLSYKLRQSLIDVIISEGGIVNQKWEEVVSHFIEEEEHNSQLIENYLPVDINGNEIVLKELRDYVRAMRTWANRSLIVMKNDPKSNDLTMQQLSSLVSFCNAFIIILNGQKDQFVTSEKLRSWILSIYKPTNYSGTEPEKGSRFVICSPAAFVDPADDVIWVDCFNGTPVATVHQFLSTDEKKYFVDNNITIWSDEAQLKAQLYSHKLAILNCKSKLTLIVAEKDKGERLSAHPLFLHLAALLPDLKRLELTNPDPDGETEDIDRQYLPETPVSVEMEEANLFIPRETESYSSIGSLIHYPLDYVLNYQAGLAQSSVVEMNDTRRTVGNVAHLFIQMLVTDSGMEMNAMKEIMNNSFSERVNAAVLQKGAVLLLDENRILLTRFANQLKLSVNNLLSIIESNSLSVTGCEYAAECKVEDFFEMDSRIDMLLTNNDGRYIIFDLKWTSSKTYYNKLIKENRALQLEVYKKVLETAEPQNPVVAVGYYDLSHGLLETSFNFNIRDFVRVTDPENSADIFGQAMNSYKYRWNQLHQGTIEVAEGLELALLEYHQDREEHNLYPLETHYKGKNLKAVNEFSDFKTFKGGLK